MRGDIKWLSSMDTRLTPDSQFLGEKVLLGQCEAVFILDQRLGLDVQDGTAQTWLLGACHHMGRALRGKMHVTYCSWAATMRGTEFRNYSFQVLHELFFEYIYIHIYIYPAPQCL